MEQMASPEQWFDSPVALFDPELSLFHGPDPP
jgi:hypothetical protein